MRFIIKICCWILIPIFLLNGLADFAYANDDFEMNNDVAIIENDVYWDEMERLGFSETDVVELYHWGKKIASASSAMEVDTLMKEYYALVDGSALSKPMLRTQFSSTTGGTLILNYIGESNPVSQVVITKQIYFTAEQVVFLQRVLNDENFSDYIEDKFISDGVSVITSVVATAIATYCGLPEGACAFLIGESINLCLWISSNLEKWDLDDAIDRSNGTGKVKMEFYYLRTIGYPYYQSFQNFEPWDSNYIEVPENYEYRWYESIYDYNSDTHQHYWDYVFEGKTTHRKECGLCGAIATEACLPVYAYLADSRHSAYCKNCSGMLVYSEECSVVVGFDNAVEAHYEKCSKCNQTFSMEGCRFTWCYYGIYNNKPSHIKKCIICGYTQGLPKACTYDTPGMCNTCG